MDTLAEALSDSRARTLSLVLDLDDARWMGPRLAIVNPIRWEIGHVPLAQVANEEKKVPREFITPDGFGITAACREYLAPLIDGEDYPPYSNGLPQYVRIRGVPVPRKLQNGYQIK